jgi:hypothetical protein
MRHHHRVFGAALAIAFMIMTGGTRAQDEHTKAAREKAQLVQETASLFQVIREKAAQPQPCEFDKDWDTAPIQADLARAIFGLKAHAGLVSTSHGIEIRNILDPKNEVREAFCDVEETKSSVDERIAVFEKSEEKEINITHTSFSFPIFTNDFKEAAILVSYISITRYNGRGKIKGEPIYIFEGVEIFKKDKGIWRHTKTKTIGIT